MPKHATVLLFDVDGTLITGGGVGRRAIERTLEHHFGVDDGCSFSFGGMTDRGIVRAVLKNLAIAVTEALIDEVLGTYLEILHEEVGAAEVGTYGVHPGVLSILEAVSGVDGVAVGLGTGNVEVGARTKLAPVGLNPYFDFGGFGCDAEARAELIAAGAERGAGKLNRPRHECRVVIIGDTLRDVEAAHAIGGECLAVATGAASAEVLRASETELLVDDLTDPRALPFLLL